MQEFSLEFVTFIIKFYATKVNDATYNILKPLYTKKAKFEKEFEFARIMEQSV